MHALCRMIWPCAPTNNVPRKLSSGMSFSKLHPTVKDLFFDEGRCSVDVDSSFTSSGSFSVCTCKYEEDGYPIPAPPSVFAPTFTLT